MKYRAVVWGIGKIYNNMYNIFSYLEALGQIEIIALTANRLPDYQYIDGYQVVANAKLKELQYELLIVANEKYYREIVCDAVTLGVERSKIVPYWVFQLPHFDIWKYMQLKNSRISIVSNNCWGGVAYHTLGLEVLSPFKNLYLEDEDYIKLLNRLKHYMECEPCFYEYQVDIHSKEKYPVILLDDIKVHFNHDKEPDEAIEKWNKKKMLINWDNLLVEMYTDNREVEAQFMTVGKYRKRICFVPYASDYRDSFRLKLMPGQHEFWEAVNGNATNGTSAFAYNLIDLLLLNESTRNRSR